MSPRPYRAGPRRQQATEATRTRIIVAARELLVDPARPPFSIDAIAERADVARMTVYYQFKSKGKLLEALFDHVAARANMRDMRNVFLETDTAQAVSTLVRIFCRLWESETVLLRRLIAMAALDPEIEAALSERNGWRREALSELLGRTMKGQRLRDAIDLLHILTSFQTYDALTATKRSPKKITVLLQAAAGALLRT